jgi:DNA polymerase III subunit delta
MASRTGGARVYLLYGPEETQKKRALESLLDDLVPLEDRELDVQQIDATNAGVTGESILHAVRERAMFSERRVVIVWNVNRFRGPRHQRTQETLANGLGGIPEFSTLILYANADDAGGRARVPFDEKLMASLKRAGKVQSFSLLKPERMVELAIAEAATCQKRLSPGAASNLAARVGTDSGRLLQEVRKLASYVGERPSIEVADIAEMVPPALDDNIFHLLDATMAGNAQRALAVLRELRAGGQAPQQIIPMIARTLRQIMQARFLIEQRITTFEALQRAPDDVREALPEEGSLLAPTFSQWQWKRLADPARRFDWSRLQYAFDAVVMAEAGWKGWETGIDDADLALEVLVARLCEQAAQSSRGSGVRPQAGSRSRDGYGRGR